ncbi:MAG: hypothetical protein ACLUN5_18865 [Oscillospiraceae bacterium]
MALGFIPVRLKGRRLGPLLRVALFCPCLYFIGETVGIRETTVTESGVFLACVPALLSAGLDGHFEKETHQTADYRHFWSRSWA